MWSVWTLALPQNCLVNNRSSSSLRLPLLLEKSDPLVTPPGRTTNSRVQSKVSQYQEKSESRTGFVRV